MISIAIAGENVTTCATVQIRRSGQLYAPAMLDPEDRRPDSPESQEDSDAGLNVASAEGATLDPPNRLEPSSAQAGDAWPAVGYWAAIGPRPPVVEPPAPAPPAWTKTYELPSARRVVSSGLQLAVDSSSAIRRASIYIGLLALGAFGPAVILLLLGIGRLASDPATADTMARDPSLVLLEQPELAGPLALIYLLVIVGMLLLVAISVDAQAIAIAILGGRAAELPMRLWEAITRARQVFWRLLGASLLVGLASGVVTLVLTLPFLRPLDSNEGITFIGSIVGTLVVAPFAFAGTGIVLGDVGAIEALQRSVALSRARPRIALVVTLFTLVTSAIQTFALGAGLDVAIRVAELMHLNLDQGGAPLILTAIIVLAFVVAFGSLTFTIAAIVAAPQVTGFLGLTFFSGGLDRARGPQAARPGGFRWVTLPMLTTMVALALAAGLAVPAVTGFQPRAASPLLAFLRTTAEAGGDLVTTSGEPVVVEDPTGDQVAANRPGADIVAAEYGYLPEVPAWFLDGVFDCAATGVTCGPGGSNAQSFYREGALLFVQRMVEAPAGPDATRRDWGAVLTIDISNKAPAGTGSLFPSASHAFITHFEGALRKITLFEYFGESFEERTTDARSLWSGQDLITIVPSGDLPAWPGLWDMYATESDSASGGEARDTLRAGPISPLAAFGNPPYYSFISIEAP